MILIQPIILIQPLFIYLFVYWTPELIVKILTIFSLNQIWIIEGFVHRFYARWNVDGIYFKK